MGQDLIVYTVQLQRLTGKDQEYKQVTVCINYDYEFRVRGILGVESPWLYISYLRPDIWAFKNQKDILFEDVSVAERIVCWTSSADSNCSCYTKGPRFESYTQVISEKDFSMHNGLFFKN